MSAENAKMFLHELLRDKVHLVVDAFHSLPHLDMWFILSNSTFDPNSSEYLETILFWTTAPILTLILILLVLILYACCLVCASNNASIKIHKYNKKKQQAGLCKFKFIIWLFVLILSGLLGLIVFGSENLHYSFANVTGHVQDFSQYFLRVGNQTQRTQVSIMKFINVTFVEVENDLKNYSFAYPDNHARVDDAIREITSIKSALYESYRSLSYLSNFNNEKEGYFRMFQQIKIMETSRFVKFLELPMRYDSILVMNFF